MIKLLCIANDIVVRQLFWKSMHYVGTVPAWCILSLLGYSSTSGLIIDKIDEGMCSRELLE